MLKKAIIGIFVYAISCIVIMAVFIGIASFVEWSLSTPDLWESESRGAVLISIMWLSVWPAAFVFFEIN
jgi:hypothetical protein